jgi:hypothetical protein
MKLAAGLTVSGIIGLIILEALKLLLPTVTAWVAGVLLFALKAVLIVVALAVGLGVIGVGIFVFKRIQKANAEA